MSMTRNLLAVAVCATACSPAWALLSINMLQDDTTVPGWVINTFTVDSGTDVTAAVASSRLTSGSMLQVPGFFTLKRSNGPGDSFININGDINTIAGLGAGDLGDPVARFDSTGIAQTWFNTSTNDIGVGMHMATLTFSDDAFGALQFLVSAGGDYLTMGSFDITSGAVSTGEFVFYEPKPDPDPIPDPPIDPDPLPDPDPDPDPGSDPPDPGPAGDPAPDGGDNPIPEPAGLGLLAVAAAAFGGLHRRRLGVAGK